MPPLVPVSDAPVLAVADPPSEEAVATPLPLPLGDASPLPLPLAEGEPAEEGEVVGTGERVPASPPLLLGGADAEAARRCIRHARAERDIAHGRNSDPARVAAP